MRLLFIGDIVGAPGREAVAALLPGLIKDRGIDFCVANAENAAGGSGVTPEIAARLFEAGVHVITTGDHVWKKKEVLPLLEANPRVLRACNFSPAAKGRGYGVFPAGDKGSVGVATAVGQVFMNPIDSPLRALDEAIARISPHAAVRLIEIHAEATSEKMTVAWHFDGKVTAVLGTHTHVPTADARILPGGTAFITDVGMTGPLRSILGRRVENVLEQARTGMPVKLEVADEDVRIMAVLIEADPASGKAVSIERVEVGMG